MYATRGQRIPPSAQAGNRSLFESRIALRLSALPAPQQIGPGSDSSPRLYSHSRVQVF